MMITRRRLLILILAAGIIPLALSLTAANSTSLETLPHQTDEVISPASVDLLEIVDTIGNGRVNGVQWSPDGQNLMAYGSDGFWIFSGDDLRRDPEFIDVGTNVLQAEYTEDNNQIIYRSREGISIIELDSGQMQLLISRETLAIEYFDYHNGLIAFMDGENIAGVWDIERARPRFYFAPDGIISQTNIRISDDGQLTAYTVLAYAANAPTRIAPQIYVGDIQTGQILYTLIGIDGHVNDVNFYDGQVFAAVDGYLYAWSLDDAQADDNPRLIELPREELFGLLELSVHGGNLIGMRERTATPLFRYTAVEGVQSMFMDRTTDIPVDFDIHPTDEYVAFVTADSDLNVINMNSGETLISFEDYWNPGFRMIRVKQAWIARAYEHSVDVYSLEYNAVRMWMGPSAETITAIDFSESESLLATAFFNVFPSGDAIIRVVPYAGISEMHTNVYLDVQEVYDMEFDASDNMLYYAERDGRLMAYRRDTDVSEQLWQVPDTQVQHIEDIALSTDGTQIALANGSLIHIYDFEAEDVVQTIEGHPYHISEMAYSPYGEWLATADGLGTLMFWDTTTWQELAYLPGQPGHTLAVSPDGALLAVGGESIAIIDTTTHQLIREIEPPAIITDVEFNDDGTRLIASSDNGKIYFWGIVEASATGEINPTQTPEKMVPISH